MKCLMDVFRFSIFTNRHYLHTLHCHSFYFIENIAIVATALFHWSASTVSPNVAITQTHYNIFVFIAIYDFYWLKESSSSATSFTLSTFDRFWTFIVSKTRPTIDENIQIMFMLWLKLVVSVV